MKAPSIDFRSATMQDLTRGVCRFLQPLIKWLAAALGAAALYLFVAGQRGAEAFAMIAAGSCFGLWIWSRRGTGVPLLPLLFAQNLLLYALPILVNPAMMAAYAPDIELQAGIDVLVFSAALIAGWTVGLGAFRPASGQCFALAEFRREGARKLRAISLGLIACATAYAIADRGGLEDMLYQLLPAGSMSIVTALLSAVASCGFFIGALLIGGGEMHGPAKGAFWLMLAANCYIAASAFLLSAACIYVLSVAIGLFWSSGRIPGRFLIAIALIFGFLNVGKEAMRDRYWRENGGNDIPDFTLSEMPGLYSQWFNASLAALSGQKRALRPDDGEVGSSAAAEDDHSLLARLNNLQNLLYVLRAERQLGLAPLHGATYAIIPGLLTPRVLDPNKPRTHEGQVMLNVHFQRQDLASTEETYIAWGLLPEATGNFGPDLGSLILGLVLGFGFAAIERWTARKLVISFEGFVGFILFLGIANSYEMVASVLVTSLEQALICVGAAMVPVARRTRPRAASA
ncbi:MAG TPA: hypothetical protein VFE31_03820 [Opitutaceae bacterium]|nr:hypothetical protein [Opitutaceae bacterium]